MASGPGRTNSDGEWVETGGDGSVKSVGGRETSSCGSGTATHDSEGNSYSDGGPSDDTRGDRL